MSARWNNDIQASNSMLKRSLQQDSVQDDDGDDDDDVSLVSCSPSPPNAMDITPENLAKYDEYVRGNTPEVITVETKIKSSNKGFAMLAKLGWADGQPLGLSGDGRVDPVPFQVKRDLTGLGKINQDVRMIETTVSQRRGLDSERQQRETEYQRKARENTVARQQALQSELSTTLAAFYCTLCSKQFKNVAQYDEHTNSYAHHHKARMKDMAASAKGIGMSGADAAAVEERKEKERKREEKELRRAAKAAGIKMAKPVASTGVSTPVVASPSNEGDAKPSGFKKSGWATVSSTQPTPPPSNISQSADGKGGWTSVGSSNANPTAPSGSWTSIASSTSNSAPPPTKPASRSSDSAPVFRTAGWTSLDTGSSQLPPLTTRPPPTPSSYPPPPPPPPSTSALPPPSPSHLAPRPPRGQLNQGQWGAVSPYQQSVQQRQSPNTISHETYGKSDLFSGGPSNQPLSQDPLHNFRPLSGYPHPPPLTPDNQPQAQPPNPQPVGSSGSRTSAVQSGSNPVDAFSLQSPL